MPPLNTFSRSCLAVAISQAILLPANAATITVNNSSDSGTADTCTLRQAISSANRNQTQGNCVAGDSDEEDLIIFDPTVFPASSQETIALLRTPAVFGTTDLEITSDMTITGPSPHGLTIDAGGRDRVFSIEDSASVSLNNLTMTRGRGRNFEGGGAMFILDSTVNLTNCTISNNSAVIRTNGAGILAGASTINLMNSTVSNNVTGGDGGGISAFFGSIINITNSTISDNVAVDGGGIRLSLSTLNLSNSTVSGNTVRSSGSNITSKGGGIYIYESTATLTNNIVSGNRARSSGTAIYVADFLRPSTVTTSYNLFGDDATNNNRAFGNFTPNEADITATSNGTQPTALASILLPLADNGGATHTHALPDNSPAIGTADTSFCPVDDQRGFARDRIDSETCNIGSYEVGAALTLAINADSVTENGGDSATTATVSRNTDTTEALTVSLASDDGSEASVPTTVVIPVGQASVSFNIGAVGDGIVDGTQTATITASASSFASGSDTLDVTDVDVATLTLSIAAASITENGGTTIATVTRNTDTTGPLTVSLANDDASEASLPTTVVIPAGQASASFTISAANDGFVDGTQTVTITASEDGHTSGSDTLDVTDADAPTLTVAIDSASIAENGGTTTATVSRNTLINPPLTVTLTSDDTSEAIVPTTVVFPVEMLSVSFTINSVIDGLVDGTQTVTITASESDFASGSDTLNVTDVDVATLTLSIDAASITENGATTATVTRNTDTTGPLTVSLANDDTSEASVPTTVVIPAGQASASFAIGAVSDDFVDGIETVTITASEDGHLSSSDTLEVSNVDTAALTVVIDADSVAEDAGASATTATVSRNTDTTGPLTVTLANDDTSEASVPTTVVIPAGQASASFAIGAVIDGFVDGAQTVTITASEGGHSSSSDTLEVTNVDTAALTVVIDADSVAEDAGASATTASVSRNTDITDSLTVTLANDDTSEASVPTTVSIPAGQASASFAIGAVSDDFVDGTQTVTITASEGGHTSGSDTLEVTDVDVATVTITINDASISENGGATTAMVTRNTDTTSALNVNLSNGDTTSISVVDSIVIPAGELVSPAFNIDAIDDMVADGDAIVILTAAAAAHNASSVSLGVIDDEFDDDVDGVLNRNDNCVNTSNPDQADFEGDGVGDACDDDIDGDGISNSFEEANDLDPRNSLDRDADPDRDGFTNGEEARFSSDPNVADTDDNNNGIPDSTEARQIQVITSLPAIFQLLLSDQKED